MGAVLPVPVNFGTTEGLASSAAILIDACPESLQSICVHRLESQSWPSGFGELSRNFTTSALRPSAFRPNAAFEEAVLSLQDHPKDNRYRTCYTLPTAGRQPRG